MAVLATFAAMAQENAALPGDTAAVRQDSVAMRNVELDELVVQESLVEHSASGDTYRVTEEMKRGVDGTLQMLGRLPGVDYNFVSDAITVRNDSKVLTWFVWATLWMGTQLTRNYIRRFTLTTHGRSRLIPSSTTSRSSPTQDS